MKDIVEEQKSKNQNIPEEVFSLVYIERDSPFGMERLQDGKIGRLSALQRAIGVIEGVVKKFDEAEWAGEIEIEGHVFPFECEPREEKLKQGLVKLIGQGSKFSFWPTFKEMPKGTRKKLQCIKISHIRHVEKPVSGYVEVIGKLEKILPGKFIVAVWSKNLKSWFYVIFSGDYPYEDELGKWMWVVGKFEPKTGVILFEESSVFAFVPRDKAKEIIRQRKAKRQGKTKTSGSFKGHVFMVKLGEIQITEKSKAAFNTEGYERMKQTYIESNGTPKPIKLRQIGEGKYLLIDGITRLTIARELGHETIKACLMNFSGQQKTVPTLEKK